MRKFLSVLLAGVILATSPLYGMDPPENPNIPSKQRRQPIDPPAQQADPQKRRPPIPNPGDVTGPAAAEPTAYSIILKKDVDSPYWAHNICIIRPASSVSEFALSAKSSFGFDKEEYSMQSHTDEESSQDFLVAKLTKLQIRGCGIGEIPSAIGKLTNLTILSLEGNALLNIPPELGNLQKLRSLDLCRNNLTELPPAIGKLTNLEVLEIGYNKLNNLPSKIENLTNLKELGIHNNNLTTFPLCIIALQKLQWLDFASNGIGSLPSSICNLQFLGTSNRYRNQGIDPTLIFWRQDSSLEGYEGDLWYWSSARIYYSTIKHLNFRAETMGMASLLYWHFKAFCPKELCYIIINLFTKVLPLNNDELELLHCYRNNKIIENKILKIDEKKKIANLEKKPK